MSVRTLYGEYDGGESAAVMVDSVTERAFGPLWKGGEAVEQIGEFLGWMRREPWLLPEVLEELRLVDSQLPDVRAQANDPRSWPPSGLLRLVEFWKEHYLVDGLLPAAD